MTKAVKKTPPHISARQQLLRHIATLPINETSSLPPERILCDAFGVSLNTVKKAIRQLFLEGRIRTVPRQGHFIRRVPTETNIGIVIGEGSVSTFLPDPDVMCSILDVLARRNCFVRVIQLRKTMDAADIFSQYSLDGCVWYMPDAKLFSSISKVMDSCVIPIVVPIMIYTASDAARLPRNHFTNDFTAIGRVRAEYLLSRGHRSIAYCASVNTESHAGFLSALAQAGLTQNPDWNFPGIEDIPERLSCVLDAGVVTAIISDGGQSRLDAVFSVLDGHPWAKSIACTLSDNGETSASDIPAPVVSSIDGSCLPNELLVDFIGGGFAELRGRFPGVKVSAVNFSPHMDIGRGAAEALVDAVKDGIPIESAKFPSYVRHPDWTPYQKRTHAETRRCGGETH